MADSIIRQLNFKNILKFFAMLKKISTLLWGTVLIVTSIWLFIDSRTDNDISVLDRLPDHDYITEINNLMQQQRWGEAETLCEDVITLELPCSNKVRELQKKCNIESRKVGNRLYKAAKAFITGEPDSSLEELGGSVVSDMFMYGDIRDLVKQGYFKLTARETDPVIAALAAVGLLTEFVDAADWAPAALKAFRKVGALSNALGEYILKIATNIYKTKKIDFAVRTFFGNLKTMLDRAGFIRSASIIKSAKSADDIALLAKSTEKSPRLTHLVARAADERTCEIINIVNKHKNSQSFMKKIARKGANSVKLISRSGKILYKSHLTAFLRQQLGSYFYLLCLLLAMGGCLLIYRSLKNIKTIFPCRKKDTEI